MTITTESNDKRIECYYDTEKSKDYFDLTIKGRHDCYSTVSVNRADIPELVNTINYFQELLKMTTGR